MKKNLKVFPLRHSPGYLIVRSATALKAELYRAFHSHGLDVTPEQWAVLNKLWEIEGLHQSELAEKTFKDRHTMTRILDLMEEKGWIVRKPDEKDSRCSQIYLSDAGRALKTKLIPVALGHLEKAFSGFTQKDLRELTRIHEMILRNLQDALEQRPKNASRRLTPGWVGILEKETEKK